MKEQWKKIEGFEDYDVSNLGRVRSHKGRNDKTKLLSARCNRDGYEEVCLSANGTRSSKLIHRLVGAAFAGGPSELQINHKNGIKNDNRADNIEWVTASENMIHAFRTGLNISLLGSDSRSYKGDIIGTSIVTGETITLQGDKNIQLMGFSPSSVSKCIAGKQKAHKGHTFARAAK